MKKVFIGIGIFILALFITFMTFEMMSWYHFGDNPTKVVLVRLIVFLIVVIVVLTGLALIINKYKKNR